MPGKTSLCYVKHVVSLEMSWPAFFILTLSLQIMAQIDTETCYGLIPVHFKEFPSSFLCVRLHVFVCSSEYRGVQSPWAAEYWVRALPGIHLLYQCELLSCLSDGSCCTDMFIVCSPCNRLPNPSGRDVHGWRLSATQRQVSRPSQTKNVEVCFCQATLIWIWCWR